VKELFGGLPWWVKWVAVPVIAIVVFGSLLGALFAFVFKLVIFVALVGGLVFVVKKFTSSSSDSRDSW
jgi:flagellar biogenesis protein FliO